MDTTKAALLSSNTLKKKNKSMYSNFEGDPANILMRKPLLLVISIVYSEQCITCCQRSSRCTHCPQGALMMRMLLSHSLTLILNHVPHCDKLLIFPFSKIINIDMTKAPVPCFAVHLVIKCFSVGLSISNI